MKELQKPGLLGDGADQVSAQSHCKGKDMGYLFYLLTTIYHWLRAIPSGLDSPVLPAYSVLAATKLRQPSQCGSGVER